MEGIGYDFIPDVLDRADIDTWIKTGDIEAFAAARLLMREEGLLVGGSSGSALAGALKWLKSDEGNQVGLTVGANVVVLLPDGCVLCFFLKVNHSFAETIVYPVVAFEIICQSLGSFR